MSALSDVLLTGQGKLDDLNKKEKIMSTNTVIVSKLRKKPNGGDVFTLDIPASFAAERGWNKGDDLEISSTGDGAIIRMGLGKCTLCGGRASIQMDGNKLCQLCIDKISALKKQQ